MRLVKKIGVWVVAITSLVMITAVVVALVFEKDIKRYAVKVVNQNFKTEINIKGIELTLIEKFPSASLKLSDVTIKGTNAAQENDTLLHAKAIYFKFDILDLWNENYTIKEIESTNTTLNIFYDNDGVSNYDILKEHDADSSELEFDLKKILLKDVHATYVNTSANQRIDVNMNRVLLDGDLSHEQFDLSHTSNLFVNEFTTNNTTYITKKKVVLDLAMEVDYGAETVTIDKGEFRVAKMDFLVEGELSTALGEESCDLTVAGNNIVLSDIRSLLPAVAQEKLTIYKTDGKLNFLANISGPLSVNKRLKVTADFGIKNGTVTEQKTKAKLTGIQLKGTFSNRIGKQAEQLEITEFSALLKGKKIEGAAVIRHFQSPEIMAKIKGKVEAEELQNLLHIPNVDAMKGLVHFEVSCKKGISKSFETIRYNGEVSTAELSLNLPALQMPISLKNTKVSIVENRVQVESKATYKSSDGYFIGVLHNLIPSFYSDKKVMVEGLLNSESFHLNDFLPDSESKGVANKEVDSTSFYPQNVVFNLKTKIKKFRYNNSTATNVSGVALLTDKEFRLSPLRFNIAGGEVSANMIVSSTGFNSSTLAITATMKKIDIPVFFKVFDNFNQAFVSYKNVEGIGNASCQLKAEINNHFTIDTKSLEAIFDLEIEDGSLKEMPALIEIADYLAEDKRMRLAFSKKDLAYIKTKIRDIHFGTLTNQIKINNSTIEIPSMLITSDLMNVQFAGSQTFSGKIDYRFGFRFRELKKKKASEFGEIEDDGLGIVIHVHMTGTTDNPEISIDKKMMSGDLKSSFQEDKKEIKSALKEDFGWFKNDESIKVTEDPKTAPEFVVDWEEEDAFVEDTTENKDSVEVAEEKESFWQKFDLEEAEEGEEENFEGGDDDF